MGSSENKNLISVRDKCTIIPLKLSALMAEQNMHHSKIKIMFFFTRIFPKSVSGATSNC